MIEDADRWPRMRGESRITMIDYLLCLYVAQGSLAVESEIDGRKRQKTYVKSKAPILWKASRMVWLIAIGIPGDNYLPTSEIWDTTL